MTLTNRATSSNITVGRRTVPRYGPVRCVAGLAVSAGVLVPTVLDFDAAYGYSVGHLEVSPLVADIMAGAVILGAVIVALMVVFPWCRLSPLVPLAERVQQERSSRPEQVTESLDDPVDSVRPAAQARPSRLRHFFRDRLLLVPSGCVAGGGVG